MLLSRAAELPGGLPFVGHERELRLLEAAWRRALAGSRTLVVIDGEAGMGATSLATAFAATVAPAAAVVLTGRATGEALIPYLPFVEALGQHVLGLRPEELASIAGPGAGYLAGL